MVTASETSKALRGTKRVCHACEVRFYDLARKPIICPACGEQHTPEAVRSAGSDRSSPSAGKTSWRSKGFKRPGPTPPVEADAEFVASPEVEAVEDAVEETADADAGADDDIVLEQEPDDGDVSGLVDRDVEEPKDR